MTYYTQQDVEEVRRDDIPALLRELVVGIADRMKDLFGGEYEECVLTLLGKKITDPNMTVRSRSFRAEVEFNAKVRAMMEEAGIKVEDQQSELSWCDSCKEEDYYNCEYSNYTNTGYSPETCPEYDMFKDATTGKWKKRPYSTSVTIVRGKKAEEERPMGFSAPKPVKPVTPPPPPRTGPIGAYPNANTKTDAQKVASLVSNAKAPTAVLPHGLKYRCPHCHHWFASETKLAGHSTHACPGKEDFVGNWVMECECCVELDDMLVSRKTDTESSTATTDTKSPNGEGKEVTNQGG